MAEDERAADAEADEATEALERVDRLLLGVGDGELLELARAPAGTLLSSLGYDVSCSRATCLPRRAQPLSPAEAGLEQLGLRRRAASSSRSRRSSTPVGARAALLVGRPERRERRGLERAEAGSSASSTVAGDRRLAELGGEAEHPAQQRPAAAAQRLARPSPAGGSSAKSSTTARGLRVVGQPLDDPDAADADGGQRPAAVGELGGLDDAGDGADVGAHVAAADLAPPLDQHDAELGLDVAGEQCCGHRPVAGLEDVQRQHDRREQHRRRAGTSAARRRSAIAAVARPGGRGLRAELVERRALRVARRAMRGELVLEGEVVLVDRLVVGASRFTMKANVSVGARRRRRGSRRGPSPG